MRIDVLALAFRHTFLALAATKPSFLNTDVEFKVGQPAQPGVINGIPSPAPAPAPTSVLNGVAADAVAQDAKIASQPVLESSPNAKSPSKDALAMATAAQEQSAAAQVAAEKALQVAEQTQFDVKTLAESLRSAATAHANELNNINLPPPRIPPLPVLPANPVPR